MNQRMLVTDDDPCLIAMYRTLFGRMTNLTVDYASTPAACQALVASQKYDLALLDISLGDVAADGFSLLRHIRDQSPETDVLMMSSQDGDETVGRCLKLGAKTFASKNRDFATRLKRLVTHALEERLDALVAG